MLQKLKKLLYNSNPLILGFGREGISTYITIRQLYPNLLITIADKNKNIIKTIENFKDNKLAIICGENYLNSIGDYYPVFRSPGISLKYIQKEYSEKITSQTDFFLGNYSSQVTGITGTKGKSTTASLISFIYKLYNNDTLLAGNIGIPFFDIIDKICDKTDIVCELSSHQLQDIHTAPHISVILNIYQEHLDYYNTYEDYQIAKLNIIEKQNYGDYCIYNADNNIISEWISNHKIKSEKYAFSLKQQVARGCYYDDNKIIFRDNDVEHLIFSDNVDARQLKGEHNLYNIMASVIACKIKGIDNKTITDGIRTMPALKHRMEYLGQIKGIHFYNDSISTIPEATIAAIKAIPDVDCLILGGYDRGIDYSGLVSYLLSSGIRILIFLDRAGIRIMNEMNELKETNVLNKKLYLVHNLEDAVKIAKKETLAGKACLLSPAAASYGMFKNFEERGEEFRKLVLNC